MLILLENRPLQSLIYNYSREDGFFKGIKTYVDELDTDNEDDVFDDQTPPKKEGTISIKGKISVQDHRLCLKTRSPRRRREAESRLGNNECSSHSTIVITAPMCMTTQT